MRSAVMLNHSLRRALPALAGLGILTFSGADLLAQVPASGEAPAVAEWSVEWGGRSRDPFVAGDGKVWFVGQTGNYIAWFNPADETFRRYEIEDDTNPHNLIVDAEGMVWYAGNRNGRIGRLNPETGEAEIIMTGEAGDPHTLIFDGRGGIWFTSQNSNRVGHLDMASREVTLLTPHENPRARPYGIVLDLDGNPWVALFGTNQLVRIDRDTREMTHFNKASEASRSRRIEVTSEGVWYVDEPRGYLGLIDPASGNVREWAMPGGDGSRPYALTRDDQGRLWVSQTGPDKKLTGFNPRTETFFAVETVSQTIRHMMFHSETGAMWFGTDANQVGRLLTGRFPG
jgi:virginiamycin B lyase